MYVLFFFSLSSISRYLIKLSITAVSVMFIRFSMFLWRLSRGGGYNSASSSVQQVDVCFALLTRFSAGKVGSGQVARQRPVSCQWPEPGGWFGGFQPCDKGQGRPMTAGLSEANQDANE